MVKVKQKKGVSLCFLRHCINSLWERLRCCPRAKRLGNSTHATALREDEPQAKTDRQSATAKEGKSKRAYENRTSIPYGKGKVSLDNFRRYHYEKYQFPMGKVKFSKGRLNFSSISVSIPYGKGKANIKQLGNCLNFNMYQSPMGKIVLKFNIRTLLKSLL